MMLNTLLSAGAFGIAAHAFLVVPETNSLPVIENKAPAALTTSRQDINIDCSTCPYALNSQRNGHHEWTSDVPSELELHFASEGNTLQLNDVPFYPMQNPTLPPHLTVTQKKQPQVVSAMEGFDGKLGLSYSLEFSERVFLEHGEETNLLVITMTIMGLDGEMVKVDDVEINAIKAADGSVSTQPFSPFPHVMDSTDHFQLHLHSVSTVPASPNAPDAKCGNILCRVFTKLIAGANKAKASAKGGMRKMKCLCVKCFHKLTGHQHHKGHKGHMAVPHRRPDGTIELPTHIQFKPHGRHHHHHNPNSILGRMALVLRTTVKVVFVPILIGVAFGMAASAIGMLVGQAVVFLWMKFRRSPENGAYERVEADEKDAPPAYQDVQGVEAMSEKEIDAKA